MADFLDIKVEGLEKVFDKLEKAKVKTLQESAKRMYILTSKAAGKTRRKMKNWIWDTGNLAGSIDHMIKWSLTGLTGFVFTPVKYGIYVHFGTGKFSTAGKKPGSKGGHNMRARPYMDIAANYLLINAPIVFKGLI